MKQLIPHQLIAVCLIGLSVLAHSGCKQETETPENLRIPRLLVEIRGVGDYGSPSGGLVTLPVSGTSISVLDSPLVSEFDITNVEMVKVDMGIALLVQVSPKGSRELYRGTVSNMGGRIILSVNGNAIGARRIDGAISDGNFYTFVEIEEEELGQLVLELKESIIYLQGQK